MTAQTRQRLNYAVTILPFLGLALLAASGASGGGGATSASQAADWSWWAEFVRPILIGLLGVSGTLSVLALKFGWVVSRWTTDMENRVKQNERRLDAGDPEIDQVSDLVQQFQFLLDRLEEMQSQVARVDDKYVRDARCQVLHAGLRDKIASVKERLDVLERRFNEMDERRREQ